jgi:Tol biopolymer transport system component
LPLRALLGLLVLSATVVALLPAAAGAGGAFAVTIGNDMPAWSPDGRTIAFVGFRNGRVGDIYTLDPQTGRQRRLTRDAAHEDMPEWSPDGSKIVFVRHTGGALSNFHLFVMNADGSGLTQLTHSGAPNFAPTWSPDGTKIAFVSQRELANSEIFVINADGTGETRLTNHRSADDSPDWSPDGTRIAFASNRSPINAWRLYVMNPDGTNVQPLTKDPVDFHNEQNPEWSPDGRRVAFVTNRDPPVNNTDIYVVDADGTNIRRVTRHGQPDTQPTWSPDSRRIVFSRGFGALRPELYVIQADGKGTRKLTGGRIRFVRITRSLPEPRAGRLFTVELTVRPALQRTADVACYGAIGNRVLDAVLYSVVRGKLRCSWLLPRSAKGKRFYHLVGAVVGHSQVTRTLSARIR